jgi:hypothetical protein
MSSSETLNFEPAIPFQPASHLTRELPETAADWTLADASPGKPSRFARFAEAISGGSMLRKGISSRWC